MRASNAGLMIVLAASLNVGCQTELPPPPTPQTGSGFEEAPISSTRPVVTRKITELQTVYFEFDDARIRSDAQALLGANAEFLDDSNVNVTIQGNTDERGTEEYNLALGERRATSVKRYLVDLGVQSTRLRTVSFGEDRPAVQGHDESAWRWNRRADFVR